MSEDEIVSLLPEGNFEESSSDVDTSNACQHRPQRSLPPGKEYHLFISYSSHDKTYVLGLKNVLEGLGFKCMVAEHDFSYGVPVLQNIETKIQTCYKLLFVVSSHFVDSPMCDTEFNMAHKYASDNRRHDFMIVLRLDHSQLPLKLSYLTYINGVDLPPRIVGLKIEKKFDGLDDVLLSEYTSENINGKEIMRKSPEEKSHDLCCSSCYEFSDLSPSQRNTLIQHSIEDSHTCYRKILEDANNHILLKRYAVFVSSRKLTAIYIILCLGIFTFMLSLCILLTEDIPIFVPILMAILTIASTIGLHIACTVCLFNQLMGKLCSIVRENTDCKSQKCIIIPRRQWNAIAISFIYYDMKPCWNFLEQRARVKWPDACEENIAKLCNEELVTTILNSFVGLDVNPIPLAKVYRHNTYGNMCCLCQLSRSPWTFGNSVSVVIPEQLQGIEDNDNEETCVMKIVGSEIDHETSVKEVDTEYLESTEENDETKVMKIYNRQESFSCGSPIPEPGSSLSLTGAEGGTSLTETASTSLFDSNIDRWRGDMCETRVRGETSPSQSQLSQELITFAGNQEILNDAESSTSLNVFGEAITLESECGDLVCFRGERSIDEATHAKVPV